MRKIVLLWMLLLMPWQAWAAGYAVYEWSARGNALGGALVARDADPSALAYNPSAITDLPGDQIQMGFTGIRPMANMDVHAAGLDSMKFDDALWALPSAYYTRQLSDHYWFGLGIFSRVGLGTDYEDADNWAGRYNCSHAAIKSVTFAPTLAMRFSDAFSLAVGLDISYLDFSYHTTIDLTGVRDPFTRTGDVRQEISADGWGYGMNLSARYRPFDWLAFGVLWRSETALTVHGDVDFTQKGMMDPKKYGLRDTSVSGTEPLPASLTFGVMVRPIERLSLEVDAVWTQWSAYETLVIKYGKPLLGHVSEARSAKNWRDTWRFQFGAEYALTDSIDLRAGYVYDQSPVTNAHEDFAVPCTARQIMTFGAGWDITPAWTVDASYGYLWMTERNYEARPAEGVVKLTREKAHAHMLGLSVTYRF